MLSSISEKALESKTPYKLTNSCAVFSESEVITQVNAGTNSSDIVAGIIHSIASKIGTLVNRVDAEGKLAAVGGVAKIDVLEKKINVIGKNGFIHHVSVTRGSASRAIREAFTTSIFVKVAIML